MNEMVVVAAKVALIFVAVFAAGMSGYAIAEGPNDLVSPAFGVALACGLIGAFLRGE